MGLSASDASDRAAQLLTLTERLTARLLAETAAYEAHRPQEAAAGLAATAELANLYRHESVRLKRDPGLLAGAPADLRARLVEATRAFEAVLARHGRAVSAAKVVSEGLMEAVAQEVARHRASTAGYGPGARPARGDATAITLNRRA